MALTPEQESLLKADITGPGTNATAVSTFVSSGDWNSVANYYNSISAEDAWNSQASITDVFNAINWDKFYPADAVPSAEADATMANTNAALADIAACFRISLKQINFQNMLIVAMAINAEKSNIRGGLQGAVTGLPSGVARALQSAAGEFGVDVLSACTRKATIAEVVLAEGTTAETGGVVALVLPFEGQLTMADCYDAYTTG